MSEEHCIHAVPQAASCLHGVCIFCYRDRLGALRAENEKMKHQFERLELFLRDAPNEGKDLAHARKMLSHAGQIARAALAPPAKGEKT
jgi:hypothetical protein